MIDRVFAPARHYFVVSSESPTSIQGSIFELLTLHDGWHYGSGTAPTLASAVEASRWASLLCNSVAHDIGAFPSINGGVMINSTIEDCYFELTCRDDGLFDLLEEDESCGDVKFVEAVGPERIMQRIGELEWQSKTSSVSYTPDSLITTEIASLQ